MCDTVAGQLIIGFARPDVAALRVVEDIREGKIEHVTYRAGLEDRLRMLEVPRLLSPVFEFHLIEVPAGSEAWKANFLQFHYQHHLLTSLPQLLENPASANVLNRSDWHFTVTPNHLLTLASPAGRPGVVQAKDFSFDAMHHSSKGMVGMAAPTSTGKRIRIAVLDSGIARDYVGRRNVRERNFVDPKSPLDADDDHGHGTVVSLIIHDLVPDAEIAVYKVADATGRASEWDTLAAIGACGDADVVSMSIRFGLGDRPCKVCGRESHSSRSAVFENMLGQFAGAHQEPVFVAAAGNEGKSELSYPARFGIVLAIGAVTSRYALSSESNYGDMDHALGIHPNHFVAPGGCPGPAHAESVGAYARSGAPWHGTSMATAYATGVTAAVLSANGPGMARGALLNALCNGADQTHFALPDPTKFGHGVLRA